MSVVAQYAKFAHALGLKRILIGLTALLVATAVIFLSVSMLNRPVRQILYSGLDAEDVNRIGAALAEAGISFDVNEAGNSVLVDYGRTAQARMLLAEKGLPKSDKSGYELFDQMGSLGLTSFMQQVTKVRALEGELVRTIQLIDGVKSARVHLALRSEGAFRLKAEQPTASVVIRVEGAPLDSQGAAIRRIVAAAIPGLQPQHVSVMTTDGALLSSGEDGESADADRMFDLESRMSRKVQERIERTLAPFVGMENLRVSATTYLNVDRRQTNETVYDPETKVERSQRTVKSSDSSTESGSAQAVSVEQNVPQEVTSQPQAGGGASKKKENKEETVNFEIGSRQTETVSSGFTVERVSVAVLLNRKSFAAPAADGQPAQDEAARLADIENLVRSAAGLDDKRGDSLRVSAVDFVDDGATAAPAATSLGVADLVMGNLGTIINAISLIVVVALVLVLGVKPVLHTVAESREAARLAAASQPDALAYDPATPGTAASPHAPAVVQVANGNSARNKLNKVVEIDVDRAAQVLKQWLDKPGSEAA